MATILTTTSSFDISGNPILVDLRERGFQLIENPFGRRLSEDDAIKLFRKYQPVAIIAGVEPLSRSVLQAASPNLKIVSRCGTGMDSVDLEAARELGITVLNTPDAPVLAVAELTLAMILDILRGVTAADRSIRKGTWKAHMGNTLAGKTVGLIGGGRIGLKVAALLSAFDAQVIIHDPYLSKGSVGFEIVELSALLSRSDIISLHLPLTAETRNFVDDRMLAKMRAGSRLINAARGGLVDETALIAALESGHLAGAALDVFEQEPYAGPLVDVDNVVLTTHMGSYAKETRTRMEFEAAQNLVDSLTMLDLKATT